LDTSQKAPGWRVSLALMLLPGLLVLKLALKLELLQADFGFLWGLTGCAAGWFLGHGSLAG